LLIDYGVVLTPIGLIGLIYWLLYRFRKKPMSRAAHYAFRITLVILSVWGIRVLSAVTRDAFGRLPQLPWVLYVLPVAAASWLLAWACVALVVPEGDSPASRRRIAAAIIFFAAISAAIYGFRENFLMGPARDIQTEAGALRALADGQWAKFDVGLLAAVARNEATPPDVLERLARHKDYSVRIMACYNRVATPGVLVALAQDHTHEIRYCVARHSNTPASLLTEMARDPSPSIRAAVAANASAPVAVFTTLSADSNKYVRQAVAANSAAPVEILAKLIQDEDEITRYSVARNPRTPLDLRMKLARDPAVRIRKALLAAPEVPEELLVLLANDENDDVRRGARYWLERRGLKNK